jgi:16S rRNA (uracil1498-N3)-methyltransferase
MLTPADVSSRAHVVIDDLASLVLDEALHHHLARVLRLRGGDVVTATNGAGLWQPCLLPKNWPDSNVLEVAGQPQRVTRRAEPVSVAFALTKNDKPELVVQKLTELGVDRIMAFTARYSVVQWDDHKQRRNVERWRLIAREAVQQSRQAFVPEICEISTVERLVEIGGFARADRGGEALRVGSFRSIAVGPEGGWHPAEQALLSTAVSLGDTVLRAETAAVTAGVLLTAYGS